MVQATCPNRAVLGQLLLGELSEQDSTEVVRHVEGCESCLTALREASASDPLLSAVRQAAPSRETVSHAGVGETLSGDTTGRSPLVDPLVEELIDRLTSARTAASQAASAAVPPPQSPATAKEQADAFAFLRPPEAADELGRLGPYRVLKVLGQGGMGVVFQAQDPRLNRLCALKVMRPEMAQRPGMKERFLREARAAAALESDYVVPIYQVDEDNGAPFIAMPFLKGMSLEDWLQTRERDKPGSRLKPAVILKLARDMARGLAEAHSQGMIHRDIKPANVWLDSKVNGRARILDFGLARLSDAAGEQHLTQSGAILGTPSYMAPEQAQSDQIDARADLFSLGVVLYRLCTGELPFRGHNTMATLLALAAHHPPAPIQVHPATPAAVSDLVMRLLAKEPDKRIGSAKDVLSEIQRIERELAAETKATDGASTTAAAGNTVGASLAGPINQVSAPPSEPVTLRPIPVAAVSATADPRVPAVSVWMSATSQASLAIERLTARVPPGRRRVVLALCGGLAALLAGILLYWQTGKGTVRIEINDPGITAQVDGDGAVITQADKPEVRLSPGDHGLKIKYGELEFETDTFVLARGGEVDLKVELLPGKVQVVQGDKTIGERAVPQPGAKVAIKGWHGWPLDAPPPAIAPFDAGQAKEHQEAWAKYLNVPVEYTNSIGMKFRLIPPGEFMMGSTDTELQDIAAGLTDFEKTFIESSGPQHKVFITKPIYVGMHEVTQKQYAQVMEVNPAHFSMTGPGRRDLPGNVDFGELPVEQVSWGDAVQFCERLAAKESRVQANVSIDARQSGSPRTTSYRLPTGAEWEWATRAGTTTTYWKGNGEESLGRAAWTRVNSNNHPHPVGTLQANPFGLFDVHGNVWEWVHDWWDRSYYAGFLQEPAVDPSGPDVAGVWRVIRGGAYMEDARNCRSATHAAGDPVARFTHFGFRVVLSWEAVKAATVEPTIPPEFRSSGWHGWPLDAPPPAIAPFDAEQAKAHQEAWAKYLGVPVEYTNSIGMKFRLIPPGEFLMGSTAEEIEAGISAAGDDLTRGCIRSEGPRHNVVLTQPFYLAVHEATQQQYESIAGVNPAQFSPNGVLHTAVEGLETAVFPVDSVTWPGAIAFCESLDAKESANGYRLPTESEWEFACRAGTATRWWTGDGIETQRPAGWNWQNAGQPTRTHAVGERSANPFGLFDIHGNVWEWVQDWWAADSYQPFADSPAIDPAGSSGAEASPFRVVRGGSCRMGESLTYSAYRGYSAPEVASDQYGFRVALSVDAVRGKFSKASAATAPYRESDEYRRLMPGTWHDVPPESFTPEVAAAWTLADGTWTFNGSPHWSPCTASAVAGTDMAFRARIEALDAQGCEGALRLRAGPDELYQGINFAGRHFWGGRRRQGSYYQLGLPGAPEWTGWSASPKATIELTAYVQGGRVLMFANGELVSEMHDPHPVGRGSVGIQFLTRARVRDMQLQYLNRAPAVIAPPPVVFGDAEVVLTGPPRPFAVKDIEGAIDVTPTSGTTPARLTIKCREGAGTAYKIAVSLPDDELNVPVAGWVTAGQWAVAYRTLPDHQGEAPPADIPAAAMSDEREAVSELSWKWGDKPPTVKTPTGPFLLMADMKSALPAGWYRLRATAGRSVRARLDGQTVLDNWIDPSIGRSAAYVQVDGGPHEWRVESFQPATDRSLSVELEPLPAGFAPPASNDPAALADRLAAEWALRAGGSIKITADGREVALTAKEIVPDGEFTLNEITPTPNGFQPADLALQDTRLTSLHLRQLPAGEAAMARVGLLERLTFLTLFETGTTNDALRHLAGLKNLEGLWVQRVAVDDAGLAHVEGLKQLKRLILFDLNLTDEGLKPLAKLPVLEELHLSGCGKVTGTFATEFRESPLKLIKLSSPFVQATTEGLTAIAALPNLETLDMGDRSRVTSDSLVALKGQRTLKRLVLGGVAIGDEAIPHLSAIPNLRELDLSHTLITEEGLARLKAALPDCKITWSPGEAAKKQ